MKKKVAKIKHDLWISAYRKACRIHFQKRALERLQWNPSGDDMENLKIFFSGKSTKFDQFVVSILDSKRSTLVGVPDAQKRTWYKITYESALTGPITFWCLFNYSINTVVTVLDKDEDIICIQDTKGNSTDFDREISSFLKEVTN